MRPEAADDLVGQERIWAKNAALRRMVEADRFAGLIFWGPPGSGKTSLARLIGRLSSRPVAPMSAVVHGVKDIRAVIETSAQDVRLGLPATLIFMDEIHRLTRSQQDVLLPALESGDVRLIGATTENPSFEVNAAVLSRSVVFRFERLSEAALERILRNALASLAANGAGREVAPEVVAALARAADGDARRSLNLLEAVLAAAPAGEAPVTLASLGDFAVSLSLNYDRQGDQHYDTISAFIKSIRASQPDAAVYYLARMLEAGEDPVFVARRLVIAASEDVGNANPTALLVATAAMQGAHLVGMPEARILLSQATTYLACSPKSNRSYQAINAAAAAVAETGTPDIPLHLRNAPTRLMKEFGYGKDYVYAHDDPLGAQARTYLPEPLAGRTFYEPSEIGAEAQLKKTLAALREAAARARRGDSAPS
jgi:putative ATPase